MLAQDAKKLTLKDLAAIFAVEPQKWFLNKEIKVLTQLPERLIILINLNSDDYNCNYKIL